MGIILAAIAILILVLCACFAPTVLLLAQKVRWLFCRHDWCTRYETPVKPHEESECACCLRGGWYKLCRKCGKIQCTYDFLARR